MLLKKSEKKENLLSIMDRLSRQRINKETADLNNMIDQMDLTHIQVIPPNNSILCVLLKCTH